MDLGPFGNSRESRAMDQGSNICVLSLNKTLHVSRNGNDGVLKNAQESSCSSAEMGVNITDTIAIG
jgi:hypothetical protein